MHPLFYFALGTMSCVVMTATANASSYRIQGQPAHRAVLKQHHRHTAALPKSRHDHHRSSMAGMASYYGSEFGIAIRVWFTHQSKCYDRRPSFPPVRHQGACNKPEQRSLRGGYHQRPRAVRWRPRHRRVVWSGWRHRHEGRRCCPRKPRGRALAAGFYAQRLCGIAGSNGAGSFRHGLHHDQGAVPQIGIFLLLAGCEEAV